MALLELVGIHKSYRRGGVLGRRERFEVLRDVHLSIEPKACVGLLGRSGSGKSTLGRIALGIEEPDSGGVLFEGRDFRTLSSREYRDARRNLQVVFQNSLGSVNPRMTAAEIVAEPLRNFENPSERALLDRVHSLLAKVGLEPADGRKLPHQFSGGELQRICIARAIALRPHSHHPGRACEQPRYDRPGPDRSTSCVIFRENLARLIFSSPTIYGFYYACPRAWPCSMMDRLSGSPATWTNWRACPILLSKNC